METRRWSIHLGLAVVAAFALACGGGSTGGTSGDKTSSDLALVDVSVADNDGVPLNQIIRFEFSEALDPDSVRGDTIQIRQGPKFGKQVAGHFEVDGNDVLFYPRLPTLPDLSDGGLQAGLTYRVTLPGGSKVATVRNFTGDRLLRQTQETFQTALAGSAGLFTDNFQDPLPPKVLFVNPPDGATNVKADSTLTLTFNRRALHPATVTSSNISLMMLERQGLPVNRPIQGDPVLTQNHDSVTVVFQPRFPLADEATYRLEVDRRVQDLTGNDVEPFVSTFTIRDEPTRTDELTLTFNEAEKTTVMDAENTTASWNQTVADALAALFTVAGGNGTAGDLTPNSNQNLTPNDFPRGVDVLTEDGVQYDVYNFRTIEIPEGVTVRFSPRPGGPNRPIKLLSLKSIRIEGTLTVSGGDGDPAEATSNNSAIPLARGGDAGPGGSDGSDNYTGSGRDNVAAPDADDVPFGGEGGESGHSADGSTLYGFGGGGGGGGHRTDGEDGLKGAHNGTASNTNWEGAAGKGGRSAVNRGFPLNLERKPNVGGAGAGSGGLGTYRAQNWNQGGAGGGGGGGGITVQSAGDVYVGFFGKVLARGGDGGPVPNGANVTGSPAAGGGAAGGSILLKATGELTFEAGSVLDVAGGAGGPWLGTYSYYGVGTGGDGGEGYIRVEATEDENNPGKPVVHGLTKVAVTYGPTSTGVYAPKGGGAPSVGQTVWLNLGVFDPVLIKPGASDRVATLFNDTMNVEVQMATEDFNDLGNPELDALDITDSDGDGEFDDTLDPSTLSEWTRVEDIESLNGKGYQFIRVRVTFQLDPNQTVDQPLPFLDFLRIPFRF